MKKKYFCSLLFAFLTSSQFSLLAQSSFQKFFYNGNYLALSHISNCTDKGFIVAGIDGYGGVGKLCLMKTDSLGNQQWFNEYPLSYSTSLVMLGDVGQRLKGGYFVVGIAEDNPDLPKIMVATVDTNGNLLWVKYILAGNVDFLIYAVKGSQASDGSLYVMYGTKPSTIVCKLDENGTMLWIKEISDDANFGEGTLGYDVQALSEGGVMVLTQWEGSGWHVIAKLTSQGDLVWNKFYENSAWRMRALSQLHDGTILEVGDEGYIQKIDSDGNVIWSKRVAVSNSTNCFLTKSVELSNLNILVTGLLNDDTPVFFVFDGDGNLIRTFKITIGWYGGFTNITAYQESYFGFVGNVNGYTVFQKLSDDTISGCYLDTLTDVTLTDVTPTIVPYGNIQDNGIFSDGASDQTTLNILFTDWCNPTDVNTLPQPSSQINIYPNPTHDQITIDNVHDISMLRVVTMMGVEVRRQLISEATSNSKKIISVDGLLPGTYLLEATGKDYSAVKILVIE